MLYPTTKNDWKRGHGVRWCGISPGHPNKRKRMSRGHTRILTPTRKKFWTSTLMTRIDLAHGNNVDSSINSAAVFLCSSQSPRLLRSHQRRSELTVTVTVMSIPPTQRVIVLVSPNPPCWQMFFVGYPEVNNNPDDADTAVLNSVKPLLPTT